MNGTCKDTIFLVPAPWDPGEGLKGQILLNFNYKVNFKDFFRNERYQKYKTRYSFGLLGHAPGVGLVGPGGQKINFLSMVMWHIKLKGMISRPGYTENFTLWFKLVALGWGQKVKYFESVGICDCAASNVF